MEQNIGEALSIMVVGMVTVFIILWLVVIIGNGIVWFTNKFLPEVIVETKKRVEADTDSNGKIAAIVAAVDIVTNGKGKVTKITRI
ncbi:MAG: OadG family protein [Bacteroidales bacterium]|nr:OadG family protein [Bacteroidales bacterium]